MQLRIVRLTIPEFLVTIAHLPLGSFLLVRRAEGNSLAKSISVALCTLGPNIGFDLPVLRYRAMVHAIPASGLTIRPYFYRYSADAIDLCDVLSSFSSQAKVSLHELCRVMGLPGKPDGISGADVERYHREGRIREIADYCESDVLNTYRVWLRYELFRGGLSYEAFRASEDNLVQFINLRGNTKPHLTELIVRD